VARLCRGDYNRGNLLYALKRYEEALKSHDRAVAIRPDYVEALTNRGATLHMSSATTRR
jgi:hypothetical protein